jgi:hypothetical protein
MNNPIDQVYVVIFSAVPGILPKEEYHWHALLAAANEYNLQTLSSKNNFFVYEPESGNKVLAATANNNINEVQTLIELLKINDIGSKSCLSI